MADWRQVSCRPGFVPSKVVQSSRLSDISRLKNLVGLLHALSVACPDLFQHNLCFRAHAFKIHPHRLKIASGIIDILSLSFIRNRQFSLRKLNAVFQKMFVLGNGFRQLEPLHQLKGKAVGQTQLSAARLAAALRGLRVQRFICKFHTAQGQHYIKKILHGVPTEPVLHQRPGFMHHIVRGYQLPPFPLRAFKSSPCNRMKRIVSIQNGVETRSVNKNSFHKETGAQSAAAAANPRS